MKLMLWALFFLISIAYAESSFRLEVKDEQPQNNALLGLRVRLFCNESIPIENVSVKIYIRNSLHMDYNVEEYYMNGSTASIENGVDDYSILKISIPNIRQGVNPEESGISLGIHYTNWGKIDKKSIFLNDKINVFSESLPYEIFKGESLVASSVKKVTPKLRFVGIRPESNNSNSTWVQIQNYGTTKLFLNSISIKDKTGKQYFLQNPVIEPKKTLRICSDQISTCAVDSFIEIISGLTFEESGEFILYNDSQEIDYIAWGEKGKFADTLKFEDKEINPDAFFKTSKGPIAGPISIYQKGDFFRAVIPEGSDSIVAWNKYKEGMVAFPFSKNPYAEPFSLTNGTEIFKHPNEETVLAWKPVNGAKTYELVVINADDKSLVHQSVTESTSQSILLGTGTYLWLVIPFSGNAADEPYYGYTPWDPTFFGSTFPFEFFSFFTVETLDGTEIPLYNLNIEPLAARKDSYMLDLKWGEHIIESDWDKPHNISGYIDEFGNRRFRDIDHYHFDTEESWRCWAVAAAMVNHYYGGNLTQDEIKYHAKEYLSNRILNALPHDEEGGGNPYEVLPWVLNISDDQIHYSDGLPTVEVVVNSLKNGTPVVVWENSHIMVVDAIIYSAKKGKYLYRYNNIDNDGTVDWRRPNPEVYNSYCLPEDPKKYGNIAKRSVLFEDKNGNGVMDLNEIYDEDKDGILDFDETYRFPSYANESDSDHDGIPDKIEIMSYTIRERFPNGVLGVKNEIYADIDGDGKRAEIDSDSDGDGKKDGQEDVNHNGLKDNRETDVYVKDADFIVETTNQYNITLYALSQLRYNDGVICYNERMRTGLCSVVSASKNIGVSQDAVLIGAHADVGNVISRGNVLLRNRVHVHGSIFLVDGFKIDDVYTQNGTVIDGEINHLSYAVWDINFYPQNHNLDKYTISDRTGITVHNGEAHILQSGFYAYIKVEAGGLLYIPAGTIYMGSLQFDSRAKIIFTSPGSETIFHVNGDFIWRAQLLNDKTQYPYIAQGFKLILHNRNEKKVYLDQFVAGNVFAPYSSIVLAQSNKVFYGTVFAENISIHQYAKIYHVDFNPIDRGAIASR